MTFFLRYSAAILLIISLGLLLRIIPLSYSHFWDETVYLMNAYVIAGERTNYSELNYRPPLLSVMFAGGFAIWNHIYMAHIVVRGSSLVIYNY